MTTIHDHNGRRVAQVNDANGRIYDHNGRYTGKTLESDGSVYEEDGLFSRRRIGKIPNGDGNVYSGDSGAFTEGTYAGTRRGDYLYDVQGRRTHEIRQNRSSDTYGNARTDTRTTNANTSTKTSNSIGPVVPSGNMLVGALAVVAFALLSLYAFPVCLMVFGSNSIDTGAKICWGIALGSSIMCASIVGYKTRHSQDGALYRFGAIYGTEIATGVVVSYILSLIFDDVSTIGDHALLIFGGAFIFALFSVLPSAAIFGTCTILSREESERVKEDKKHVEHDPVQSGTTATYSSKTEKDSSLEHTPSPFSNSATRASVVTPEDKHRVDDETLQMIWDKLHEDEQ